jgi:hypothetical protein
MKAVLVPYLVASYIIRSWSTCSIDHLREILAVFFEAAECVFIILHHCELLYKIAEWFP